MNFSLSSYVVPIFLFGALFVMIIVAVSRWIFRINEICNQLDDIIRNQKRQIELLENASAKPSAPLDPPLDPSVIIGSNPKDII